MSATDMQLTDVKALATRVLQRNQQRNRHATESCAVVAGDATDELRQAAGKDWPELEANHELLECFARMVAVRKMRERGEVPPSYTATTICAHCGPVPIFPGVAEKVEGCPWCFNRIAGRPVPKMLRNAEVENVNDC